MKKVAKSQRNFCNLFHIRGSIKRNQIFSGGGEVYDYSSNLILFCRCVHVREYFTESRAGYYSFAHIPLLYTIFFSILSLFFRRWIYKPYSLNKANAVNIQVNPALAWLSCEREWLLVSWYHRTRLNASINSINHCGLFPCGMISPFLHSATAVKPFSLSKNVASSQ